MLRGISLRMQDILEVKNNLCLGRGVKAPPWIFDMLKIEK